MNILEVMHYDNKKRPVLLILPGGGYSRTSEREAFPVAYEFLELGFHQAIYYYREELLKYPEIYLDALKMINKLINDPLISDIHIIGFSAGGHLAAMLLTQFPNLFKSGILSYPVITSQKEYIHERSFDNLVVNYDLDKDSVSLERRVNKFMPPIFLWHTKEDRSVPYQNSVIMHEALLKVGVDSKLTLYEKGPHGLSLVFKGEHGDTYIETRNWIKEAKEFLIKNK